MLTAPAGKVAGAKPGLVSRVIGPFQVLLPPALSRGPVLVLLLLTLRRAPVLWPLNDRPSPCREIGSSSRSDSSHRAVPVLTTVLPVGAPRASGLLAITTPLLMLVTPV